MLISRHPSVTKSKPNAFAVSNSWIQAADAAQRTVMVEVCETPPSMKVSRPVAAECLNCTVLPSTDTLRGAGSANATKLPGPRAATVAHTPSPPCSVSLSTAPPLLNMSARPSAAQRTRSSRCTGANVKSSHSLWRSVACSSDVPPLNVSSRPARWRHTANSPWQPRSVSASCGRTSTESGGGVPSTVGSLLCVSQSHSTPCT
mmetsp:Transcript_70117/g.186511  ORF Transcript_70117/g.186511 Transcript_70117/m.186511 type:complete len:203 (+) Transcript_70117:309-917(+)